jgi:hypothetical protein
MGLTSRECSRLNLKEVAIMQNNQTKRPNLVPKQNMPQAPKTSLSTDGESSIHVTKKEHPVVVNAEAEVSPQEAPVGIETVEPIAALEPVIEDLDDNDEDFDSQTPTIGGVSEPKHLDVETVIDQVDQQAIVESVAAQVLADANDAVEKSINTEMQPPVVHDDEQPLSEAVAQRLEQSVHTTLSEIAPVAITETNDENSWGDIQLGEVLDTSINKPLISLVLAISSLGVAVRKTLVATNSTILDHEGSNTINLIALVVRLPKSPIHPNLSTLNHYQLALERICQNTNYKISARPFLVNKSLSKTVDLDEIAESIKVGNVTPFYTQDNDKLAAQDIVILVSPTGFNSTLKLVGELNSDSFVYSPTSLDVISPALDAVSKYMRLLVSKGYEVSLPDHNVSLYSNFAQELQMELEDYEPFSLDQYQEQFSLLITLGPHQRKEELFDFVVPEFLGQRLLEKANAVSGGQTNRFLNASAFLMHHVSSNKHTMGATADYLLTMNFVHSAEVYEILDAVDEDEEDSQED